MRCSDTKYKPRDVCPWFGQLVVYLFEKDLVREILDISPDKTPIALICIGKPNGEMQQISRKDVMKRRLL